MVNNHGKYYLVCNYDKYDNLANYKIENISNICITEEPVRPLKSLPNCEDFSVKKYIKEHIYMMSGSSVNATLKIDSEKRVTDIIEWFGEDLSIYKKGNIIYSNLNVSEDALVYWALQYGEHVEVIEPLSTRTKIKERLAILNKKYGV